MKNVDKYLEVSESVDNFAVSYFENGGNAAEQYRFGIFYALTLIYNGFVPPCYGLMAITAILGVGQRDRRNRFSIVSNNKQCYNMSKRENICLSGNNSTPQPTAYPSEMGRIFSYNGNDIVMRVQNGAVYVNLTEFAKPFPNKNLTQIINSQEIKEYCESLSKLQNYSLADLLIVKRGGNNSGTWAHQKVALRVAQRLSSDFAVWVDTKIEELLTIGVSTVSDDDEAIAYAMGVLQKRLEQAKAEKAMLEAQNNYLTNEIKESAPKVKCYDDYISSNGTYTVTQIAKEYGWGAETLNRKLREKGVQYKQNGQWILYAKYDGNNYTKSIPRTFTRSDGSTGTQMQTVWTSKGREFIHSLF